jgi:hypothetical protein
MSESLIDKLETAKYAIDTDGPFTSGMGEFNNGLDKAIAIIHQYEAEQVASASMRQMHQAMCPRENTLIDEREFIAKLAVHIKRQLPSQIEEATDCKYAAAAALKLLQPYLRESKREIIADYRIEGSLTYLHNMLDRRLSHKSEAEAAWSDDLLEHVKALQEILVPKIEA